MSVVVIRRPPRQSGPEYPQGQVVVEPPPEVPESAGGLNLAMALMYLPMAIGPALFMFTTGASTVTYVVGGVYVAGSVAMAGAFLGRGGGDKRRKLDADRRDYLRYLGQVRRKARRIAAQQREALYWRHPDPGTLCSIAAGTRLWERRPGDPDFADIRVALGPQRLAMPLVAPQTKPVEDLEPLCAGGLRRLLGAFASVPALPVAISLRSFGRILVAGDPATRHRFLRAILAQLATFHAPDDLRVVVCASADRLADWEWLKWLPHALHPSRCDAAGPLRLVSGDLSVLEVVLDDELRDRPRVRRPGEPALGDLAHLVVILDGGRASADSDLAAGLHAVTVIELVDAVEPADSAAALCLQVTDEQVVVRDGTATRPVGRPDGLAAPQAEALARQLAPLRSTGTDDTFEPLITELGLPDLLGVRDVSDLDLAALWRVRAARDRLRVPIGVTETGAPVELDLKESAQGGMGPHGLLVGATGSGKSELLRTLVLALALTHSSETLNFVLVDFKGGATFLGLERLPHTSAVITNLAEELPLVDRMYDAVHGELVRRQELLRACGNLSSQHEYERARDHDATLAPLPSLFVVVDEFSELLSSKPDFAELFVMIGRLGRSLGVHLLLASQRLDEGRLRGLESHLSYRIGLRMFSGMESRAVLGVPDAYELPATPGSGYLRLDTATLTRFKAAYVSGPAQPSGRRRPGGPAAYAVLPYQLALSSAPPTTTSPDTAVEGAPPASRVLEVVVGQLADQGPPAHQVWLPPLAGSTTLDGLLAPLITDPARGLTTADPDLHAALRVPVGVVDRPFEQRHDVLWADLSGSGGSVAIVGRPQSGKSTLLRTLLCALALTHTPSELQFYCLDFGGGGLSGLAGLPHVGRVASRREADAVRRTVAELSALLDRRERALTELGVDSFAAYRQAQQATGPVDDPYGEVFLVIDGQHVLRQEFDALEPAITDLAARGLGCGIHVVITANRWMDIRPALRDLLGSRFELRLGEPFESEMNRRAASNVPERQPGRGITREGLHFAAALPRVDGVASATDIAAGIGTLVAAVAAAAAGPVAPPIRLLPELLPAATLHASAGPSGEVIPIGVDEDALAPVALDFAAEPHLLVLGDSQSGKSNLLRLIADSLIHSRTPEQARIIAIDYRRALSDTVRGAHLIGYAAARGAAEPVIVDASAALGERLPGPDLSADQLRAGRWWRGAELYLLVDDYELVEGAAANPLHALLELVPHARDVGLHIVLARSSGGASRAFFDPLLQRIKETGSPILALSGSRDEPAVIDGVRFQPQPPGRGTVVSRRLGTRLIQTAFLAPDS